MWARLRVSSTCDTMWDAIHSPMWLEKNFSHQTRTWSPGMIWNCGRRWNGDGGNIGDGGWTFGMTSLVGLCWKMSLQRQEWVWDECDLPLLKIWRALWIREMREQWLWVREYRSSPWMTWKEYISWMWDRRWKAFGRWSGEVGEILHQYEVMDVLQHQFNLRIREQVVQMRWTAGKVMKLDTKACGLKDQYKGDTRITVGSPRPDLWRHWERNGQRRNM